MLCALCLLVFAPVGPKRMLVIPYQPYPKHTPLAHTVNAPPGTTHVHRKTCDQKQRLEQEPAWLAY